MMRILFTIILLLIINPLYVAAQLQDTAWFNADWKKTTRDSALYYRPPVKKDGPSFPVKDYYLSGQLQMDGHFSSLEPEVRQGYFIFYDSLGNKENEGTFDNNQRTGVSQFYYLFSSRKFADRTFEHDTVTKLVVYDSLTGTKTTEGSYLHGKRTANWTTWYRNGAIMIRCYYDNDSLHGKFEKFDSVSHNLLNTGNYNHGKKTGKWTYGYKGSGLLHVMETYTAGQLDGLCEIYDSVSHKKLREGMYRNDQKEGVWKYYNKKDGLLSREQTYVAGKMEGPITNYDSLGTVLMEGNFVNDLRSGEWRVYYKEKHQLKTQMYFENDLWDKELVTYFPGGNIKRREHWDKGKMLDGKCFSADGTEITYYPYIEKPSFPGDLKMYTETYLQYPFASLIAKREGKVKLSFTVEEDGTITDVYITKGIGGACDEAAIQFMNEMPAWNPGKLDGAPSNMLQKLVISFQAADQSVKSYIP